VADLDAAYWAGETDSLATAIEALADGYATTNPWAEYEAARDRAVADKVGDDPGDPDDPSLAMAEATLRKATADEDHALEVSTAGFAETASNAAAVAKAVFELAVAGVWKLAAEVQSDIVNTLAAAHLYRPSLPEVPGVLEDTSPPAIDAILADDYAIADAWTSPSEIIAVLAADRFQVPAELADSYTDGVASKGLFQPVDVELDTPERRAARQLAFEMVYFSVDEFESLVNLAKDGADTYPLRKKLAAWAESMKQATAPKDWSLQVDQLVRSLRQLGFPLNAEVAIGLSTMIASQQIQETQIKPLVAEATLDLENVPVDRIQEMKELGLAYIFE